MRKPGVKVRPRRRADIFGLAGDIRSVFELDGPYVLIENIYEIMPELLPRFNYEIVSKAELGDDEGITYPSKQLILIREDVYDGACMGNGRDRFTMAHELGHLFMHDDVKFARDESKTPPKIYMDSEWQADCFASGFLINAEVLKTCQSIREVAQTFGVSYSAAECRFGK